MYRPCRIELPEGWRRYTGVEDYYDPCQSDDESSDGEYGYCTECTEGVEKGSRVDLGIRSELVGRINGTWGFIWFRVPIHEYCLPSYLNNWYTENVIRDRSKQHYLVVSRSSRVLLLLEALGLLRDVAWPIVAAAYWLL